MNIKNLTIEEIQKFASRKGVKENAVFNFLSSMGACEHDEAQGNLCLDARLYKWNAATVKAIQSGILFALNKK